MHSIEEKKLLLLRPEEIFPSCDQPRKVYSQFELRSLAESISASGIIEPLCVRRDGKNRYMLISGSRRLKAAKMIGLRRLPCVVHSIDEKGAAVMILAENLQHSPLNFFEQAQAIDKVLGVYGISKTEMSQKLGITETALKNKLKLLKIEPLERERILSAGLTESHARALLRLNEKDISLVLDTVIEKQLSVRQTERFISAILSPKEISAEVEHKTFRKSAIGNEKIFSNSLSKLLSTLKNSGIEASSIKKETEDYIEYEIRIEKNTVHQLSLSGI
ncbi:MAG: ParB/RepB/Spo0J family partition protein [Clostridia bacterium]|nr:ParB/RepB/Spo0J family partition protein [Clostridia bacterium]